MAFDQILAGGLIVLLLTSCYGATAQEQTDNALECGERLTRCREYCEPWTIQAEKDRCLEGCDMSYNDCIQYGAPPKED